MSDYKKLLQLLEAIDFPKQTRANISNTKVTGFVLGLTRRRVAGQGRFQPARRNTQYPELYRHLLYMIHKRYPNFRYQAIQVNKNVRSALHLDRNNEGDSYITAVGDFKGGELYVKGVGTRKIRNRFYKFNGSTHWHKAMPHTGTRYSVVFFKYNDKQARGKKIPK